MKKGKVFFHPIDGSGPLTISWSSGPKGDAVEAKKGSGVGFLSEKRHLICVIFDDVQSDNDHQILEFNHEHVEITVKNDRVAHTITQHKAALIRKTVKRNNVRSKGRTRLKIKSKAG